jgi:hypothetical protein
VLSWIRVGTISAPELCRATLARHTARSPWDPVGPDAKATQRSLVPQPLHRRSCTQSAVATRRTITGREELTCATSQRRRRRTCAAPPLHCHWLSCHASPSPCRAIPWHEWWSWSPSPRHTAYKSLAVFPRASTRAPPRSPLPPPVSTSLRSRPWLVVHA